MPRSIVILALVLTSACQPTTTGTPDATTGGDGGGAPRLAGRYVSDCVPSPGADGTTQYVRLDFELTDSRWDLDYVVNADEACEVALVTTSISGPYVLERPSETVEGAWEARFAFDSKTIRPEIDALRDVLNGIEGCGAAEFVTGVAQDVHAVGCPAFGQYPSAVCMADYDLVHLDEAGLRFGERPADNDLCTPARRPTALSPLVSRRR